MRRLPPRSTSTDPLFPYTPRFRSGSVGFGGGLVTAGRQQDGQACGDGNGSGGVHAMFPGEETPPSGDAATRVLASSVMRRNEDYARAIIQVFGEHPGSVGRVWAPGRGNCSGTIGRGTCRDRGG